MASYDNTLSPSLDGNYNYLGNYSSAILVANIDLSINGSSILFPQHDENNHQANN